MKTWASKYAGKGAKERMYGGPLPQLKKQIEGDDIHSGIGKKRVVVNLRGSKGRKNKGTAFSSYSSTSIRFKADAGLQTNQYLLRKGFSDDWLQDTTDTIDTQTKGWFAQNPNSYTTGSAQFTAGVVQTEHLTHTHDDVVVRLGNLSDVSQYHQLYVFECIKDCASDPLDMWGDGLGKQGDGLSAATLPAAGVTTAGTAGYCLPTMLDIKPRLSREMKACWRIAKVTDVYLAAGANEIINYRINCGQTQTRERVQKAKASSVNFLKGMYFIFDIACGQVIDDTTAASPGIPTTSSVVAGSVTTCFSYFQVRNIATRSKTSTAIYHIPTATAEGAQKIILSTDAGGTTLST